MENVGDLADIFETSFLRQTLHSMSMIEHERRSKEAKIYLEKFKESDWLLMGSVDYLGFLRWSGCSHEVVCNGKESRFNDKTNSMCLTIINENQISETSKVVIEYTGWGKLVLIEPITKPFLFYSIAVQKHDPCEIIRSWSYLMKGFDSLTFLPHDMRNKEIDLMSEGLKLEVNTMLSIERILRMLSMKERDIV
jgi:hypothetical protein